MQNKLTYRFLGAILLFVVSTASATEITPPEKVGLDSRKLALIDTMLNDDIAASVVNAATLSIMRKGKLVYHKAFGTRGPGASSGPLKTNDIFRIYSMTKPITSVAVMMLVEQGRIKLNDPLSKYVPAFASTKVMELGKLYTQDRAITIADLLRHTSGIVYGFFGDTEVRSLYRAAGLRDNSQTLETWANKLADLPLEHQPGEVWEYSHSTAVLGRVVEVASGQQLDQFLKEHIFDPLGMNDTGFYVPPQKVHRIVEPRAPRLSNPAVKPRLLSGGGGLMSTPKDYLAFCTMMLNGGSYKGQHLLKPQTVVKMTRNQLGDIQPGNYNLLGGNSGFGYGFAVRLTGGGLSPQSKGSYRWAGYAGTHFWIDPVKEMIVVFMIQNPGQSRHYIRKVRSWVYGALK
ncbi:MAG: beta-lactamase family protein [Alphaproteobacteria bacterium]|jgi:CubicO group peptidase (beta-lactamase class C family)|nr:beta-lactamase family protein [Alphaproteobacteria bacterium]MBT4966972.1 beta-lactamase family protein [Alphaproteobacteria bacterium]MBT6385898.1 beta-lactamase family protein [Alphaproteobacteria bacterium]